MYYRQKIYIYLNSEDINLVKGLNSSQLLEKLDQAADEEIIHRNNLILS